ncbi:MAG: hypothetical protein COA85_00645 [Robiginitomaculum sp.]|nr:MAG: hypothetical protein COA85_00645 [Robiginitomaculum sp.]
MRSIFVIVLLLLGIALTPTNAHSSTDESQRYRTCLAKAHSRPSAAYEDAVIWKNEGGAGPARHCLAMALLGMRAYAEGADKLESLAYAPDIGDEGLRTPALIQSGEAWLQASRPEDALRVLTRALDRDPNNAEAHTKRARALMALEKPIEAHTDLDAAIRAQPDDALALRLRAAVLLYENDLSGAQKDIEAALSTEPNNVEALLVRGQIREAKRLQ